MMMFFVGRLWPIFVGLPGLYRLALRPAWSWNLMLSHKAPVDYPSEGGFMAVRNLDNDGLRSCTKFLTTAMLELPAQSVWRLQRSRRCMSRAGFGAFPITTVRLSRKRSRARTIFPGPSFSGRLRFGAQSGCEPKAVAKVLAQAGVLIAGQDRGRFAMSRHNRHFNDIWHCAANRRPFTSRQMVCPSSTFGPSRPCNSIHVLRAGDRVPPQGAGQGRSAEYHVKLRFHRGIIAQAAS